MRTSIQEIRTRGSKRKCGLNDEAIASFLRKWSEHVHAESAHKAGPHAEDLLQCVHAKPEILELARTPVMLTALAVVHWNERRIPDQRAELYQSVLRWLAAARSDPERLPERKLLDVLGKLAFGMLAAAGGRRREITRNEAADLLEPEFGGDRNAVLGFLDREELRSGMIVGDGVNVRFWHLTFLEFLAARQLNGMRENSRYEALLTGDRTYLPEWRETVLLLAGILHGNGPDHVDGLVGRLIDRLGTDFLASPLAERVAAVALAGVVEGRRFGRAGIQSVRSAVGATGVVDSRNL
ncbi:MAG: hypothetical protein FJW40_07970 [Acidobacteria bacterium]|nr:hypothetical protein [Acidobacteriota bacterium]